MLINVLCHWLSRSINTILNYQMDFDVTIETIYYDYLCFIVKCLMLIMLCLNQNKTNFKLAYSSAVCFELIVLPVLKGKHVSHLWSRRRASIWMIIAVVLLCIILNTKCSFKLHLLTLSANVVPLVQESIYLGNPLGQARRISIISPTRHKKWDVIYTYVLLARTFLIKYDTIQFYAHMAKPINQWLLF